MADPNKLLYQELEALTVIGFMAMIPMVVASQGPIALVEASPHWWGPFKVREVPDEGQKSIIDDVESSELGGGGGLVFLLGLPIGPFLVFTLVAFLLGLALRGRLIILGGYHNCL